MNFSVLGVRVGTESNHNTIHQTAVVIPEQFVYSMHDPPLHVRLVKKDISDMDISVPDDEPAVEKPEDPLLAKRIRDYFKTIKQHKTSVPHTTLLESGQTHGEFCICYLQTLHKRRQNNTMQKKTKDERRFQNTSLERFQNTGVLDQEEPIESGDDNDNSDDDEEINKVIC